MEDEPLPPPRTVRIWLKELRIGFLPVVIIMMFTMPIPVVAGLHMQLTALVLFAIAMGAAAHILWFWYGSVLNDYYDQDIDKHHPFGEKMFTKGYFSNREKKRLVLAFAISAAVCEIPQAGYILYAHANNMVDLAAFVLVITTGFVMATIYSAPPIRTRRWLLGATYTLMFVFVIAFLRFSILLGGWNFVLNNGVYILGICGFIYLSHGITTISLKDIPDAFSDRKGGVRSIPLVHGFKFALYQSMLVLAMTMGLGALFVLLGWVQWWFLISYIGVIVYVYLFRDMNSWIDNVARNPECWYKIPMRKKHHVLGYLVNWGIWIPLLMVAFNARLFI
jgi:4-hydroxybenzoate polyprenyltransferase